MALNTGLNRRTFLRSAGATALLGAVGGAAEASPGLVTAEQAGGRFDFDTVYNRIGTDSTRWDEQLRIYGKDSVQVGMGIADMDFKAAPSITKALLERLQHENWGYMTLPPSFKQTIAQWNKKKYGLDVNTDLMDISTGVHPGLIAAIRAFNPVGSKVLLLTPTYNGFYSDLRATKTIAEESPLKLVNGKYSIDFEDFERRISHDTHTFILCNPQNPTGNCWSPEDLTRLGEICLRRRVVVLADEIHCDFVARGNKYTPFATLPNKEVVKNSLTFKAASKSFGLAAMKCAWYFSTNPDYFNRVKDYNKADLTTLGMIASRAAYEGGEEWLDQVNQYVDDNLTLVERFIAEKIPSVKMAKPQGTYLAWLDVSAAMDKAGIKEMTEQENNRRAANAEPIAPEKMFERYLVKHAKVQLNPGNTYGRGGEGHMRMNIATSRKLVELALNNMAAALNGPRLSMP